MCTLTFQLPVVTSGLAQLAKKALVHTWLTPFNRIALYMCMHVCMCTCTDCLYVYVD